MPKIGSLALRDGRSVGSRDEPAADLLGLDLEVVELLAAPGRPKLPRTRSQNLGVGAQPAYRPPDDDAPVQGDRLTLCLQHDAWVLRHVQHRGAARCAEVDTPLTAEV